MSFTRQLRQLHTTLSRSAGHKQSIQFLGAGASRWANSSHEAQPHPAAPSDMLDQFASFQEKQKRPFVPPPPPKTSAAPSSSGSSSGKGIPPPDVLEWWELPERFRKRRDLTEEQMMYIESAGAICEGFVNP